MTSWAPDEYGLISSEISPQSSRAANTSGQPGSAPSQTGTWRAVHNDVPAHSPASMDRQTSCEPEAVKVCAGIPCQSQVSPSPKSHSNNRLFTGISAKKRQVWQAICAWAMACGQKVTCTVVVRMAALPSAQSAKKKTRQTPRTHRSGYRCGQQCLWRYQACCHHRTAN